MKKACFAAVGHWSMQPVKRGMQIFLWDSETGILNLSHHLMEDRSIGQLLSGQDGLIYYVVEHRSQAGFPGGGQVGVGRVDEATGQFHILAELNSCGSLPCYLTLNRAGDYLLVTHHAARAFVSNPVRREDGSIGLETVYERGSLTLIHLTAEGLFDRITDIWQAPGTESTSILHSAAEGVDADLFYVTENCRDQMYVLSLDREQGRLAYLGKSAPMPGCGPRYQAMDSMGRYLCVNHESKASLSVFAPEGEVLRHLQDVVLPEGMPSDVLIHESSIYAAVRGADVICVLQQDEQGQFRIYQTCGCGGRGPRGLQIDPGGNFLYCANTESGTVTRMPILPGGLLGEADVAAEGNTPGCLCFV